MAVTFSSSSNAGLFFYTDQLNYSDSFVTILKQKQRNGPRTSLFWTFIVSAHVKCDYFLDRKPSVLHYNLPLSLCLDTIINFMLGLKRWCLIGIECVDFSSGYDQFHALFDMSYHLGCCITPIQNKNIKISPFNFSCMYKDQQHITQIIS